MDKYFIIATIFSCSICVLIFFKIHLTNEEKFIHQLEYYIELNNNETSANEISNSTEAVTNVNFVNSTEAEIQKFQQQTTGDAVEFVPPSELQSVPIPLSNSENDFTEDSILSDTNQLIPKRSWPKLTQNPINTTIFMVHIPKTAGSTFRNNLLRLSTPYFNFYPPSRFSSWNSPGCKSSKTFGGTHCSFSELLNCYRERGMVQYVRGPEKSESRQYTGEFIGSTSRYRVFPEEIESGTISSSNEPLEKNIRWITIIRDPIKRVVSEYFYWRNQVCSRPSDKAHPWSNNLCLQKHNFTNWIISPFNSAHNKYIKSLNYYPDLKAPLNSETPPNDYCINVNGIKDNTFFFDHFTSYQTLNSNYSLLQETIKNIETNFIMVADLDYMVESKVVANYVLNGFDNFDLNSEGNSKEMIRQSHASHADPSQIMEEHLNLIRERNQLDLKLHRYFKEKLMMTIRTNGLMPENTYSAS